MCAYRIASKPIAGPSRDAPVVHVNVLPRLFFYPAQEGTESITEPAYDAKGKLRDAPHTYGFGRIYVLQGGTVIKDYPARGGPKETFKGADRHIHSPIPPGIYTLGRALRYTTKHWPNSSIPWGAKIRRAANGEIQFDPGSGWQYATGCDNAPMTEAARNLFARKYERQPKPSEAELINEWAKRYFDINQEKPTGTLVSEWKRNDFGEWAFAILREGKATGFFIHTTPEDELATTNTLPVNLEWSHGCIHVRPADRNEAKRLGYFGSGVTLRTFPHDAKGPPK